METQSEQNFNLKRQSSPKISTYCTLGRSGLRVSPLCLGAMTFGTEWGWGCDSQTAREIFFTYIEAGGNFIDTANIYTNGYSEKMIGEFMADAGNREQIVVATKYSFNTYPGDPNAGGNGRKNLYRSIEVSLRRLKTDFIDLLWLHGWDSLTPAEEVVSTMNDLVRAGKVRYFGLCNTPAWYLAHAQVLAMQRGYERICALQVEYSLIERNIEREHIPASLEFGIGICPWSPLGSGFLTGKYSSEDDNGEEGRLQIMKNSGNPGFAKFTERNWQILSVLLKVAKEIGKSPAQVALNWVINRPGVVSTLIGATQLNQLQDNLGALDFAIPDNLYNMLSEVGSPELIFPYIFFQPDQQGMMTGGVTVKRQPV